MAVSNQPKATKHMRHKTDVDPCDLRAAFTWSVMPGR